MEMFQQERKGKEGAESESLRRMIQCDKACRPCQKPVDETVDKMQATLCQPALSCARASSRTSSKARLLLFPDWLHIPVHAHIQP